MKNNFIYYKYIYNIIGIQISIYTNKLFFIMFLVIYVYITVNILFKLILIGIVLESKYIYNTYIECLRAGVFCNDCRGRRKEVPSPYLRIIIAR